MARELFPLGRASRRESGFTLVELLIVVAIIGVLSTVAIPTFRRMIAKSKKSEAKVVLGGIYTAEQAFITEYGGFGNNLSRLGVQTDGSSTSTTYTAGFPSSAACGDVAAGSIMPTKAGTLGLNINNLYPNYYTVLVGAPAIGLVGAVGAGIQNAYCMSGNVTINGVNKAVNVFQTTGDSDSFAATATGAISPGYNKTNITAANADVWAIDNQRNLVNVLDGVH